MWDARVELGQIRIMIPIMLKMKPSRKCSRKIRKKLKKAASGIVSESMLGFEIDSKNEYLESVHGWLDDLKIEPLCKKYESIFPVKKFRRELRPILGNNACSVEIEEFNDNFSSSL